jgi:hypothetical protein
MGQIALTNPLLVARSGGTAIIVSADDADNPMADAQVWRRDTGYGSVKPLQVYLKFLYYVEDVIPPVPWVEPA